MIILTTASKAEKKSMRDYIKVIVSDNIYEDDFGNIVNYDGDTDDVITTREFLPDHVMFSNYMMGYMSMKKFAKEYWKDIYKHKEKLASLMMILIAYKKGKKIALVCDDEEVKYDYLECLGMILSNRYGIKIGNYKDVKNDKTTKNKIKDEDVFKKDLKSCKEELKEIGNYSVKKDKKKKHKKDKDKKKKKKKDKPHFTYYNNSEEADGFESRVKIVTRKKIFKNK